MLDRREKPRLVATGAPSLEATLPLTTTVVPHDISESGMCARWATWLPAGDFPFTVKLQRPTPMTARVVWQRPLPGGQVLAALRFVSMSKRSAATLRAWLRTLRRSVPRHEDFIPVEIVPDQAQESFTAVASDISRNGMQINHDARLPEGGVVAVLMPLPTGDLVEVRASVRWQKESAPDGVLIGLQFVDASTQALRTLDEYVKKALQPHPEMA